MKTDRAVNREALLARAAELGWAVEQTGGGCLALHRTDAETPGGYWWITDTDGSDIPASLNTSVALGRYDAEGEPVMDCSTYPDFYAAHLAVGEFEAAPPVQDVPRAEQARQLLADAFALLERALTASTTAHYLRHREPMIPVGAVRQALASLHTYSVYPRTNLPIVQTPAPEPSDPGPAGCQYCRMFGRPCSDHE